MQESVSPDRPLRGLPPEEALERWSDPEAYAAMLEYRAHRTYFIDLDDPYTDPRAAEYERRRRPLERDFSERLQRGELLATAIPENADPTASRTLLDPEIFSHNSIAWMGDAVHPPFGTRLDHVEIFEPPGVPRNVRIIPQWYWDNYEPGTAASEPTSPEEAGASREESGFRHDAGYRHVQIRGFEFNLTRTQAKIVEQLHEAYLRDDPWQYGPALLGEARSNSMQLFQIFRRQRSPHWSLLIDSDGRGYYRLNIRK